MSNTTKKFGTLAAFSRFLDNLKNVFVKKTDKATASTEGVTKLYTELGTHTDGAVTQAAIKTEIDAKAPLASPALTGTPTAPTAATTVNNTQVATTAYVNNVDKVVLTSAEVVTMWNIANASEKSY